MAEFVDVDPDLPYLKMRVASGAFYYLRKVDGQTEKWSFKTKDPVEAKAAYQKRYGKTRARNAATSCNKAFEQFLARPGRDDATKARHRTSWRYAKSILGPMAPNDVRAKHILDVYETVLDEDHVGLGGKQLSDSSVKKIEGMLGPFFRAMASVGMECRDEDLPNPVDLCREELTRMLDERREQGHDGMFEQDEIEEIVKVLSQDEVERMAAQAAIPADPSQRPSLIKARQLQFLIEFGPEVGWRISESLGSKLADYRAGRVSAIQVVRQRRFNGKASDPHTWTKAGKGAGTKLGDRKRVIPLTPKARQILDDYIADGIVGGWLGSEENPHGLLIPNSNRNPLNAPKVGTEISEVAAAAGIDRRITPHYFRHTYATREWERGVEIKRIAKRMGDTEKVVKDTYLHIDENEDLAAFEAMLAAEEAL